MKRIFVNKQFTVQARDIVRSWFMAVGVPFLLVLLKWADSNGEFVIDWKLAGFAALSGSITFVVQKFLSPPKVVTTYTTNEAAKAVAEDIQAKNAFKIDSVFHLSDFKRR